MRMAIFCAAAALVSFSSGAAPIMFLGAGAAASCGGWLKEREGHTWYNMANWALGFISGAEAYGYIGNVLGSTDSDGVVYWLDKHCRDNPDIEFSDAVKAFIDQRRLKGPMLP
jgi:hypothetical protein